GRCPRGGGGGARGGPPGRFFPHPPLQHRTGTLILHQASCARSARAACRSGVSKPSVNQVYRLCSIVLASSGRPCAASNRARLVVARSSSERACWVRAISTA